MAKITDEAREYVKEWAYDSFDCGHIMDIDDYEEFAGICQEDEEDDEIENKEEE